MMDLFANTMAVISITCIVIMFVAVTAFIVMEVIQVIKENRK